MVWTEKHDMLLCREIITADLFTDIKKGTARRSAKWAAIAEALVAVKDIDVPFRVDKRAVRDRYNLLAERMRIKIKNEEKASSISPTRSEVEEALEYLIEKEDAFDEIHKNNMNRKDDVAEREKAEELRNVAMESLGTTKRRKEDEKENSLDCKQPKRRRSAGSETMAYLRKKSKKERQGRAEEIELRKAQLELEQKNEMMFCKCCNNSNNNKSKLLQCCSSNNSNSNNSRLNFP
ncbi:hypothetical protein AWC38_SpisGene22109 [Stylophora pistillata]|uniref:Uncharacterized protein n=1 Tax=Stylophora pistillata TaxID=50429 RepID=A0A2B4R805_STYPI|nr:hypothetical protein AWC38_SpisGene22109 [Stylophora pistillata]